MWSCSTEAALPGGFLSSEKRITEEIGIVKILMGW